MSTGYQISEQDELHYVTFQIVCWVDLFTRQIYRDIVIDSLRFCQQHKGLGKINYIHENPVRAGIVEHPEDYLYSSARNYADLQGVLDVIPVQFSVERTKLMRSLR
jgi:hypothetical protein